MNEISLMYSQIDDHNNQLDPAKITVTSQTFDELEENSRKARKALGYYQVYTRKKVLSYVKEIKEKNRNITVLAQKNKSREGNLWLSQDLLLLFVLCTLVVDPTFLLDLRDILFDVGLSLCEYYEWINYPCYYPYPGATPHPYTTGTAWAIRAVSIIAGLAFSAGLFYLGRHLYARLRSLWCRLAARITASLLIIVSVLGSSMKEYLPWNTVTFFLILLFIAMKLIRRFEAIFASFYKTDDWKHIRDHNDKFFYITFYIFQISSLIKFDKTK